MNKLNPEEEWLRRSGFAAHYLSMTDEQRLSVLSTLKEVSCFYCGRLLAEGERCHCNNDE